MIWILMSFCSLLLAAAAVVVLVTAPRQGTDTYLHLESEEETIRQPAARSGTITQEFIDQVEKYGGSPEFVKKLREEIKSD